MRNTTFSAGILLALVMLFAVIALLLPQPALAVGNCGEKSCGKIIKADCQSYQRCTSKLGGYYCVNDASCGAAPTKTTSAPTTPSVVGQCGATGCGRIIKSDCQSYQRCTSKLGGYYCVNDASCGVPVPDLSGKQCKAAGGTCRASCYSTNEQTPGNMDCGMRWGWLKTFQMNCCTKKPCSDGTPQNACSATKPKYCGSTATLTDSPMKCGCPDGLVPKGFGCVTPTPVPATTPIPAKTPLGGTAQLNACQSLGGTCKYSCSASDTSAGGVGCEKNWLYKTCCVKATPTTPKPAFCAGKPDGTRCDYYPCITGSVGGKCPGHCSSSVCVSGAPVPAKTSTSTPTPTEPPTNDVPSCSDTDTTVQGPTAYDAKGTCKDTGPSAICKSGCTDVCPGSSEGAVGGALNEYYCYAKRCYMKQYSCPSTQKCSNGACVPIPTATPTPTKTPTAVPTKTPTPVPTATPSCVDTDTSSNTFVTTAVFNYGGKGTCKDTGPSAVCKSGCTDVCPGSSEGAVGGALQEYYCYAKRCYMKQYSCPSTQKCSNGACVPA